ncbi:MAG: hypothetical protein U0804_04055 [Gemmataceae bacterium]
MAACCGHGAPGSVAYRGYGYSSGDTLGPYGIRGGSVPYPNGPGGGRNEGG